MAWKRFVFSSDVHGDMIHQPSAEAFFKFCDIWKPTIRIMGGDLWDLRPLRHGASTDERQESIIKDLDMGEKFFDRMKPTHFLRGNHDERLWELADKGKGAEADLASKGIMDVAKMLNRHKTIMRPYHKRDGVLKIGSLKFLHGFAAGIYAARQHGLVYGSCLFGHVHYIDEHPIAGLERRTARAVGCLCKLNLGYNDRHIQTLRQNHGFAFGVICDRTGTHKVWQAEDINGKWIVPSDIVEL